MEDSLDNERCNRIRDSMQEVFKQYHSLRRNACRAISEKSHTGNKYKSAVKQLFWDVVVLTTFDEAQKVCFQRQVENKRKSGQLPEVPVYVIADPPGQKLGVGGSTLHVLAQLHSEFSESLYEKRILLIHSGGSSQRLPSYSTIGKIFSPVPVKGLMVESEVPQMLDLKLALYLPFCHMLGPGVFVTCADDIETYCLELNSLDQESLKSAEVVALAHPSSLTTGEGHGVYVINDATDTAQSCVRDCVQVLQKPTQDDMKEAGAVWVDECGGSKRESVWSDSVFWLGRNICCELLQWFIKHRPLAAELDAYAHFLPCLGSRNSQAKPSDFSDYRAEMLPIFQSREFKVILLPDSEFYHLGTMEEYLAHFNILGNFCHELGIIRNTSNIKNVIVKCEKNNSQLKVGKLGTLIQTEIATEALEITVPNDSTQFVIEKSVINLPIRMTGNVILSGCTIQKCPTVSLLTDILTIVGNLLYHTVPIMHLGQALFVTVAFDVDARMKAESNALTDIKNYGCNLGEIDRILDLKLTSKHKHKVSLWNAQMFCGAYSPSESFWLTHHDVNKVYHETNGVPLETDISSCKKCGQYSMKDLVEFKDLERL